MEPGVETIDAEVKASPSRDAEGVASRTRFDGIVGAITVVNAKSGAELDFIEQPHDGSDFAALDPHIALPCFDECAALIGQYLLQQLQSSSDPACASNASGEARSARITKMAIFVRAVCIGPRLP